MKTIELLLSLSYDEKGEFGSVMENEKSKWLHPIWISLSQIRKPSNIRSTRALFEQVVKMSTLNLTYLNFRQQLTILNSRLKQFLVNKTIQNELEANPNFYNQMLTKAYFDRNIRSEFNASIEGYIDKAEKELQHEISNKLLQYAVYNVYQFKERKVENFNAILSICERMAKAVFRNCITEYRKIEIMRSYAQLMLTLGQTSDGPSPPAEQLNIPMRELSDNYSNYLYLISKSYGQIGDEKLNTLESAIGELQQCHFPGIDVKEKLCIDYCNVGIIHLLQKRHVKAHDRFNRSIELIEAVSPANREAILYNTLINLIHWGRYQEAIDLLGSFRKFINHSQVPNEYFLIMRSLMFVFLKRTSEARSCIQQIKRIKLPATRFYKHFIEIIAGYQDDDTDEWFRKNRNLAISISKPDSSLPKAMKQQYEEIAGLFFEFSNVMCETPLLDQGPILNGLRQKVSDYKSQLFAQHPLLQHSLPLNWLEQEIASRLEKKSF